MNKKSSILLKGEEIVFDDEGFIVTETQLSDGMSLYTIYTDGWNYISEFEDITLSETGRKNFRKTDIYDAFIDIVDDGYYGIKGSNTKNTYYPSLDWLDTDFGDYKSSAKPKTPEEIEAQKKKEAELVESLCKSDTIVFHKTDSTTVMLNPIYEGRGWDVYHGDSWSGELSKESIHELIKRHKRIVCLGHGSPYGLIGGIIGESEVPLLKEDKKIFALWCYAATFFKKNGFSGTGIMCSDNCPSEVWECKAACNADVSAKWIYDNMVYLSECLKDVIELSFTNPEEACRIAKEKYSKSKATTADEKKVVEFNTNTLQVV